MKASGTGSKREVKILNEIRDVLLRIEEHLLSAQSKNTKSKKQLLND
tara:strand:+ start:2213 stop:2353 length:141 start_codon:yes stop_codon:yes gene_type:complete